MHWTFRWAMHLLPLVFLMLWLTGRVHNGWAFLAFCVWVAYIWARFAILATRPSRGWPL